MKRTVKQEQRDQLKFAIHQVVNRGVSVYNNLFQGKVEYFLSDNVQTVGYESLEDLLDELFPPPTKEELQEKVDKLEKKVEDLTQKLRQRAII